MKTSPHAKLPLHRMAVFTPGRLNDDEIRASYIARTALLDLILEDITNTRPKTIPQHHLFIGQRGMGKTTLLRRIHVALREEPFAASFIPLGFPEEQYSVDRLSTVFLNCLDALADTLEREEASQDLIDRIDEAVERLRRDSAADEIVAQDAERMLMEFAAETDRRPVLLVDNLDLIFDRLKKAELHHLRAFLMKNGAPILIGAAVHPPEDNYGAPFYDHFKPHFLGRLSLAEMREVLLKLAEQAGNEEIPARLDHEKGRLHALHALTGGNPRTTRILFEIFAHGFSQEAYEDLEALLDWMTPIYKARFEELSDQAQVVVSAIATIWEPAMLRTICEVTRLKSNQVSPLLDRLKKSGVIEEVTVDPPDRVGPIPDRRTPKDRTGYQLAERFFNIWFLMRQATRRDKRNLIHLTRFIECWFTPEERRGLAEDILRKQDLTRAEKAYGLALEQSLKQQSLRLRLHDHLIGEFIQAKKVRYEEIEDLIDLDEIPHQRWAIAEMHERLRKVVPARSGIDPSEFADTILSIPRLVARRDEIASANLSKKAAKDLLIEAQKNLAELSSILGQSIGSWLAYLYRTGIVVDLRNPEELGAAILRADSKDKILACLMLGAIAQNTKNLSDAAFKAIQELLKPKQAATNADEWLEWAERCDDMLERNTEAIAAYERVLAIDPNHAQAAKGIASLHEKAHHPDDVVLAAYRRAVLLNPGNAFLKMKLGRILHDKFGYLKEAENLFKEALEDDANYAWAWFNLALLQKELGEDVHAAKQSFRKSLELEPENAFYWSMFADLLSEMPGMKSESEKAYRRAVEIDPEDESCLIKLGSFLAEKSTHGKEAVALFRKAVDNNPASINARSILARHLAKNKRTESEAIDQWLEILKLDSRNTSAWLNVALWMQQNGDDDRYSEFLMNAVKTADRWMLLRMVRVWGFLSGRPLVGKDLLKAIRDATPPEDRHELLFDEIIVDAAEDNWGKVSEALSDLIRQLGERMTFPQKDRESWLDMSVAILHFGHGDRLLNTLVQLGVDQRLRPWTEALRAHVRGDRKYLRNAPAEVRESAGRLYDEIALRLKALPQR